MSQSTAIRPGSDNTTAGPRLFQDLVTGGKKGWLPLAVALSVIAIFHLATLLRAPAPFVDEGWLANRAWGLVQTGRNFGTVDVGVVDRYAGYWTYFPFLGSWFLSLAMRVLGPTLLAARLVSLIFGMVLLGAIYMIAKSQKGPGVALLAVCLLSLSRAFFFSAHLARQDVIAAALGFVAVALYVTDRSGTRTAKSLISGLLVGAAFEVHPNGAIYGPVIGALYLFDCRAAIVRSTRFWGFVVGGAVGVALYAAYHVVPYPATYAALTNIMFDQTHNPPITSLSPIAWWRSFVDYAVMLGKFQLALVVIAAVVLLRRRSTSDLRLLVLFGVVSVTFVALVQNKAAYYEILVSPAAYLVIAAAISAVLPNRWYARPATLLPTVLIGALLGASIVSVLSPLRRNALTDYNLVLDHVRQDVPATETVMGPQTYWFAIPNSHYLSWQQLIYFQHANPGSTLTDAFTALHPDMLIIDANMDSATALQRGDLSIYGDSANMFEFLFVPKPELDRVLAAHATLLETVHTLTYGDVRVYHLTWGPH